MPVRRVALMGTMATLFAKSTFPGAEILTKTAREDAVVAGRVKPFPGFHLFLEPSGLPIPLALLAAEIYLAWTYRAAFAPMLHLRTPLPLRAGEPAPERVHLAA